MNTAYNLLKAATNNFSSQNEIGFGGWSTVYKVWKFMLWSWTLVLNCKCLGLHAHFSNYWLGLV